VTSDKDWWIRVYFSTPLRRQASQAVSDARPTVGGSRPDHLIVLNEDFIGRNIDNTLVNGIGPGFDYYFDQPTKEYVKFTSSNLVVCNTRVRNLPVTPISRDMPLLRAFAEQAELVSKTEVEKVLAFAFLAATAERSPRSLSLTFSAGSMKLVFTDLTGRA